VSASTIVRIARKDDVTSCVSIQKSRNDSTFSLQNFVESISNNNAIFLVAEQEKTVVGFMLGFVVPTKKEEALIHSTMVHGSLGGKGIGRQLVRYFADYAFKTRMVKVIYAEVEDGPDKFYEKCGFKKVFVWDSMRLLPDDDS
jgi:ribosomal protein S18 acetylase RimI-like enzyme